MRALRAALLVLASLSLISAQADAAKTKVYAPPGKAGTSQYAEDIPTAGGDAQPPSMTGGNKTAAQISSLGSGKVGVRKLARLGKTGAGAAQFAQQTAPAGAGHHLALSAAGGSALTGLEHLIGGSDQGGLGIFLPLLMALGVGVALVLGLLRIRRPD